ncbi:hypothetical protein Ciccas_013038, partial [Cichlidogyrus casuarinus]
MAKPKQLLHSAYYLSKTGKFQAHVSFTDRQESVSSRCCADENFYSYSNLVLGIVTLIFDLWAFYLGIRRYIDFKVLSNDPRFGGQWDQSLPLIAQISSLIVSLGLIAVVCYTLFKPINHSANDGISLGQNINHGIECEMSSHEKQNSSENAGFLSNLNLTSIQWRKNKKSFHCKQSIKPFSGIIQLILAIVFLFPIQFLEAEEAKNEALPP